QSAISGRSAAIASSTRSVMKFILIILLQCLKSLFYKTFRDWLILMYKPFFLESVACLKSPYFVKPLDKAKCSKQLLKFLLANAGSGSKISNNCFHLNLS